MKNVELIEATLEKIKIIRDRLKVVAYRLELPRDLEQIHDVFHVSLLRKYISDLLHALETSPVELREDLSFEVQLVGILD